MVRSFINRPTAYVDTATDRNIQKAVGRLMKDRTMLVIAHRLDTVANSDFILTLEDGVAKEFAPAKELLRDNKSKFAELMKISGTTLPGENSVTSIIAPDPILSSLNSRVTIVN